MTKIIKTKKQNKFSKIFTVISFTCFLLLAFTIAIDPLTYGDFFIGTTLSTRQQETDYGSKSYLIVRLDDGHIVEVKQTDVPGPFLKGKRLIVQECYTLIFKRKSYRFIKNIDKQSKLSEEQQLNQVKKSNEVSF